MDTLTHLTIGACLGEAIIGRQLGKRAMLWGAIIHTLPDIDVVSALWLSTPAALLAHRGITHSFLFCVAAIPLLAYVARRLSISATISRWKWLCFFGSAILLHDLLDAFNNYGAGWFEPFNQQRIAFNMVYVVDPFLTVWPLVGCLVLLRLRTSSSRRKIWQNLGLGMTTIYLLYCATHKWTIDHSVREMLKQQKVNYTRYLTTPAPLQNWLWYVVAGTDQGYYTGYRSVFDHTQRLSLHYFPRNIALLTKVSDQSEVQQLVRFSQQFYTAEIRSDRLVFNDLRFGQIAGWQDPAAQFAFYYFINHPLQNRLVVQRGRFAGWNLETLQSLYWRVKGY